MKVFLSHSNKDALFVQKLAAELNAEGLESWCCETSIETSANFVAEIDEGLKQSDVALLIWSPDASRSAWTTQEWTSALARQVEERRIRLAVILLRDHPLPELLRTSNNIDARSDWTAGIRTAVEWLKHRRTAGRFAGLKAPVFLPYRPKDFVGRNFYLSRLHQALGGEPATLLLYGEPGAGKSTLAIQVGWEVQKDFDAIVFQVCGQRPVDAITVELGERLDLKVKSLEPQKQRSEIKRWLAERRSLLILDDVWGVDLEDLIPGPAASVLCTSRQRSWPWIFPSGSINIEGFSESEAASLFKSHLGSEAIERYRGPLLDFAQRVEWMPLAIAVGASVLRNTHDPLDQAALALGSEDLTVPGKGRSIPQLFQAAISVRPEIEQRLLVACAVCASEEFWLPLAIEIAGLEMESGKQARDGLVNSSLLRLRSRERQRSQLHALLREECQKQPIFSALQKSYVEVVQACFQQWEQRWQECRECFAEVVPVLALLGDWGAQGRIAALGSQSFAAAHRAGDLEAALRIIESERSFWERQETQRASAGLQRCYGNEALIRRLWGDLDTAQACLKTQEEICRDAGPLVGLADCYANQSLILKAQWREEQLRHKQSAQHSGSSGISTEEIVRRARELLDEAMALRKKEEQIRLDMNQRKELAYCYGNQALLFLEFSRAQTLPSLSDLKNAMDLSVRKEALCTELNDANGLQIVYEIQAALLMDQDRLDEAEVLLLKKLPLAQEIGNPWGVAYCYLNMAILARKKKQGPIALRHAREALCRFRALKMASQIREVSSLLGDLRNEFDDSDLSEGSTLG